MIWDYIRDFLVQYIFGGTDSAENTFGNVYFYQNGYGFVSGDLVTFDIGGDVEGMPARISIGDWLSTTFTIIIMCMFVVFAIWLVRWVYKVVVSAFLLK